MTGRSTPPRAVRRRASRVALGSVAAATSLLLALSAAPAALAADAPVPCAAATPGGPVLVDATCIDPTYSTPVIDAEEDIDVPVPVHRVSGHFEGTTTKFTIYLPPAEQWEGRFFQWAYPIQTEVAKDRTIVFGVESGGYTVQTTGTAGYRHDAAAAKFAREVAADYYGQPDREISGYVYGGSGGSYQSIGAAENTTGVWQGAVPSIISNPTGYATTASVRALAGFVLRDRAAAIEDAAALTGSISSVPGLSPLQQSIAVQADRFGLPPRAWEDFDYVDTSDTDLFVPTVRNIDRTYATDFWSLPGYLGTEQSELGDRIRAAKVDTTTTVRSIAVNADGTRTVTFSGVPASVDGVTFDFTVNGADGTTPVGRLSGTFDAAARTYTTSATTSPAVLAALVAGRTVRLDNLWHLAMYGYHRHVVPASAEFTQWDQFRKADGTPVYPQRAVQVSPLIARSVSGGAAYSGAVTMKTIVVDNLYDTDALPWGAAWYTSRAKASLGAAFDDTYRVYFNDHADHQEGPVVGEKASRLVEFTDSIEQALRDVSAWAEDGVAPPASTQYRVVENQVLVPQKASQRLGAQPVVDLTARGRTDIEVKAGQPVSFTAKAQTPPGAGQIVSARWDFLGTGEYGSSTLTAVGDSVVTKASHTYTTPGTYFATVQVASQRDGSTDSPVANVANLSRVRVTVK
ncbi:PKD domain-containing protein [Rathayibacter sp. Leaf296]|uniref:PKD domain-containing protein n=1 Tax=Rathayibacter sp. Leaf296 TaxID=1736327 RepID=UPI0007034444|nr:PKD domain-containing protein [Rathayibacter sp. Leaf296]KQQ09677.1 hypothetical protein ASF46_00635 [Rathayibacter sp. Leaf296]